MFDLSNKIIVITGISGQLGLEYAKAFLDQGAKVVGLDLNSNQMIFDYQNIFKDNFLFLKCDITNKNSLINAQQIIIKQMGEPEVLINNAAIDSPPSSTHVENGPFESYPESLWDKIIDVNLKGVFLTCQIFGSNMALLKRGSIINISSIYGILSPDQSIYDYKRQRGEIFFKPIAYSASKSGVINLTKYLAVYWAKKNVRVNNLIISGVYNNQETDFLESYCKRIPIGRMADSKEYNGTLIYLASNASSYMTGSNLILDGGWTSI
jgi:NAD(P)-dependent dehydrogenase (short-subunit alcohol dehydrogenase family)